MHDPIQQTILLIHHQLEVAPKEAQMAYNQIRQLTDTLVEIDMALVTASAGEAVILNAMRERTAAQLRSLRANTQTTRIPSVIAA